MNADAFTSLWMGLAIAGFLLIAFALWIARRMSRRAARAFDETIRPTYPDNVQVPILVQPSDTLLWPAPPVPDAGSSSTTFDAGGGGGTFDAGGGGAGGGSSFDAGSGGFDGGGSW